jgi:hypothetical protein
MRKFYSARSRNRAKRIAKELGWVPIVHTPRHKYEKGYKCYGIPRESSERSHVLFALVEFVPVEDIPKYLMDRESLRDLLEKKIMGPWDRFNNINDAIVQFMEKRLELGK